jgi:hypothetical protein
LTQTGRLEKRTFRLLPLGAITSCLFYLSCRRLSVSLFRGTPSAFFGASSPRGKIPFLAARASTLPNAGSNKPIEPVSELDLMQDALWWLNQPKPRKLKRPFGRCVAQAGDTDAARRPAKMAFSPNNPK